MGCFPTWLHLPTLYCASTCAKARRAASSHQEKAKTRPEMRQDRSFKIIALVIHLRVSFVFVFFTETKEVKKI